MKSIHLLLLCVLNVLTCNDAMEKQEADMSISYESGTRMSTFEFKMDAKNISITKTGFDAYKKEQDTPADAWEHFQELISRIDLESIESLKMPSSLHASDQAAYGRLVIKTGKQTYTSPMFDDNNPPSEIKALIEEIYNTAEDIGR